MRIFTGLLHSGDLSCPCLSQGMYNQAPSDTCGQVTQATEPLPGKPELTSHHKIKIWLCLAIVTSFVAMHLVVPLRCSEILHGGPHALLLNHQSTLGDPHITHLAPILPPGIAHDPIHAVFLIVAPTNNGDDMIDALTLVLDDSRLVIQKWICIDATGD